MSSGTSKKKRPSLQDVVDKLSLGVLEKVSEEFDSDEATLSDELAVIPIQEKRRSSTHRLHLAKAFAAPSSPNASESSAGDDITASDKEIIEEELPKGSGPVAPMRCGVCGLRVYKSYRYISRSNAPIHLKIFFDPDTERFRVCKRCFSSKERCRQNLALILLKSQTEQNVHLRSPLGTTQGRRTHSMKFLYRDISRSLKRPYEDLICDETFDEDYLSDGDENVPLKTIKKEPISAKTLNNDVDKSVGTGAVTVVRPSSNAFQVFPNHFTIYGELGQTKTIEGDGKTDTAKDMTMIKMFNKKPEEKADENDDENGLQSANGELKSEIQTINYKLTLLDHAYALPAAKSLKYNRPTKPVVENVPKVIKSDSIAKTAIKNMVKNNALLKKVQSSSTENKDGQPTRTCGIVCSICNKLVTKSYSCYRKDNAPEKIKCYFTGDVKVMKVCRRCVPYKKPKGDGPPTKVVKNKVKILHAKFLKHKIKNAKKASKVEAKSVKSEMSSQMKDKTGQKSPKEGNKTKVVEKEKADAKMAESSVVHLSPKKDTTVVHVSIKNGKVERSTSNSIIKTIFPPVVNATNDEMKNDVPKPKSTSPKGGQKTEKTQVQSTAIEIGKTTNGQAQSPQVMFLKLKGLINKSKVTEKNDSGITDKEKTDESSSSVDFGTQPMHSMIGLKKARSKYSKKDEDSEKKTIRKESKETPAKGAATNESTEVDDKVTGVGKGNAEKSGEANTDDETAKDKESPSQKMTKEQESPSQTTTKEKESPSQTTTKDKESPSQKTAKEKESPSQKDKDSKAKSKTEQPTDDQVDKGKLNSDLSNSKLEAKVMKPMSAKPLIEPVRSSPRRDKNIVPPEKTKKDTEIKTQATTTVVTRKKRGISESESENTKQTEEKAIIKQSDEKTNDKQTDEKPSDKVDVAVKRSTRKGRGMKRKDSECSSTMGESSSTSSIDGDKKEAKKARSGEAKSIENDKKEIHLSNHNYSTRWAQSPIKCGCCHENVVKSYRCVQLGGSPAHLKPIFTKEGKNTLRICRKCLNFPSRVKSFL